MNDSYLKVNGTVMIDTCILFRKDRNTESEFDVANSYFDVRESRVGINRKLVIARYSALPFYRELENDLSLQGSHLINSYSEHNYIASFDYYNDIKDLTPKTWFRLSDIVNQPGPFVIKGCTNSRKFDWKTHMFAEDYPRAVDISCELAKDPLIGSQGLIYRQYVPLKTLEVGINGTPFANEWRFFFYKTKMLSQGFYWTISSKFGTLTSEGEGVANVAAQRIANHATFFAVDVAEDVSGRWWVIEVNDGQQSGICENDPNTLYRNLNRIL